MKNSLGAMDCKKFPFDDAIDLYFKSTPPPEWTYLGFLKAIKPYCISEARSIVDQKAIWRKRYLTYLSNLNIEEKNGIAKKYAAYLIQQLGGGVVPPKRLCELSVQFHDRIL
ncbi:19620_t:CDS:2, partial [Gigaspora rosea]